MCFYTGVHFLHPSLSDPLFFDDFVVVLFVIVLFFCCIDVFICQCLLVFPMVSPHNWKVHTGSNRKEHSEVSDIG